MPGGVGCNGIANARDKASALQMRTRGRSTYYFSWQNPYPLPMAIGIPQKGKVIIYSNLNH
jgi:hypothetical protein